MGAFTAPTQTDREFHPVDKTYATTAVRKALTTGLLTRDDADLITEFVTELQASQGITTVRVNKITSHLVNWRRYICPYREANTHVDDVFPTPIDGGLPSGEEETRRREYRRPRRPGTLRAA